MRSVQAPAHQEEVFSNIRKWAPPELVNFLDQMLILLPDSVTDRLKEVMDALPAEGEHTLRVVGLVQSQWAGLQSEEWVEIALVGPGRTGKSSLLKALSALQLSSARPIFSIADVQGLEEFLGYSEDQSFPEELHNAAGIALVLDAQLEVGDSTVQLYEALRNLRKPTVVVLNKIDLAENPRQALNRAGKKLGTRVVGVSAVQPWTLERLLRAIVGAVPESLYPLAWNFPELRRSICSGTITRAALASAVAGAIPTPVADLLPITAIQTGMLLKIARAFGFDLNQDRARELIPMLAAAVAMRGASHRLRQRFPECRGLIGVSVAGSWTFLLGHAASAYFQRLSEVLNGGRPILQEVQ